MPEQVGRIVRIKNRFPGPPSLAVNTVGEGRRRHINLCFTCARFAPNDPERDCPIAQAMFEYCTEFGVATALVRCSEFEPRAGVRVQNTIRDEDPAADVG